MEGRLIKPSEWFSPFFWKLNFAILPWATFVLESPTRRQMRLCRVNMNLFSAVAPRNRLWKWAQMSYTVANQITLISLTDALGVHFFGNRKRTRILESARLFSRRVIFRGGCCDLRDYRHQNFWKRVRLRTTAIAHFWSVSFGICGNEKTLEKLPMNDVAEWAWSLESRELERVIKFFPKAGESPRCFKQNLRQSESLEMKKVCLSPIER